MTSLKALAQGHRFCILALLWCGACSTRPSVFQEAVGAWEADLQSSGNEAMRLLIVRDSTGIVSSGVLDVPLLLRPISQSGERAFRVYVGTDSAGVLSVSSDGRTLSLVFAERPGALIRWNRRSDLDSTGWPTDTMLVQRIATATAWRSMSEAMNLMTSVRPFDGVVAGDTAAVRRGMEDARSRISAMQSSLMSVPTARVHEQLIVLRDSVVASFQAAREAINTQGMLLRRMYSVQSAYPEPDNAWDAFSDRLSGRAAEYERERQAIGVEVAAMEAENAAIQARMGRVRTLATSVRAALNSRYGVPGQPLPF